MGIRIDSAFTVFLQHPTDGTTHAGDEFATFDLANRYARQWATEEWGSGNFEFSGEGKYIHELQTIEVEDISRIWVPFAN